MPVRVLVVDDSEVFRNVLSAVVAATRGSKWLAATRRDANALKFVLLDERAPDMDGIETAAQDPAATYPGVVVLRLTATRQASLQRPSFTCGDISGSGAAKALAIRFQGFLPKARNGTLQGIATAGRCRKRQRAP
jgi:CheY-like chemotaxis protein